MKTVLSQRAYSPSVFLILLGIAVFLASILKRQEAIISDVDGSANVYSA